MQLVYRKLGVQPVLNWSMTLHNLPTRVKGTQKYVDKGVVHQILCTQCGKIYNYIYYWGDRSTLTQERAEMGSTWMANVVHWMKVSHNLAWEAISVTDPCVCRWTQQRVMESH